MSGVLAARKVRVDVPATTANLGPGFDTCGMAFAYTDTIEVEAFEAASGEQPSVRVDIQGEGADYLPRDERHLVVKALREAGRTFGFSADTGLHLTATNRIPQARGMGSSASAIVSGVTAAAALAGLDVADKAVRDQIFEISARLEGHPDNVAPAVYGGLTVSWKDADEFHTVQYPVSEDIHAWVFVPDFELSTQKAREALPETVPLKDALTNVSRVALLPAALGRADNALLFDATLDTLHQPYRAPLMQPSADLVQFFRTHGLASTISGAGPCVLLLHAGDITDTVRALADEQLSEAHWRMLHVPVDRAGVRAERIS
ncbi:homoserine kinase [Alloscardovia macacae]|uniref:Homoserine kinase n=1 Tax=Alloscardovia macacae TaxID=1160091 RepID=A0A1Y2SVI7_9BIFI|nr:homoserine kinase [Alloscardovia macacae]OTA26231.1 homoserine kinase [Alloscardovia macacae]OTA28890.1 homoserine kinase [Alloscardovia macacae]